MEFTWLEILQFAGTVGVATALLNQGFGIAAAALQRRSDRVHQRFQQWSQLDHDERKHLRDLQASIENNQLASHLEARDKWVAEAAKALSWIHYTWGNLYGIDTDWIPENEPQPYLDSPGKVIEVYRNIALQHPSQNVRHAARALDGTISGHYGALFQDREASMGVGGPPTVEQLSTWYGKGDELIELMHAPPGAARSMRA